MLITQCYHDLSSALAEALGGENANWCTYATWALQKNYFRAYETQSRYADHFRSGHDESLGWAVDRRTNGFEQERLQAQRELQVKKILGAISLLRHFP